MQYFRQLIFSVVFFTRLRVPRTFDFSGITLGACAWTYPLIGALIGALSASVYIGFSALGLPIMVAAWAAIIAQLLLTGGLHEDGLADSADGMAYGRDIEKKLTIMRDSRIGAFGVLALICIIGLHASLISAIPIDMACAILIAAASGSRLAMALLMAIAPQARTEGMAAKAGTVSTKGVIACLVVASVVLGMLLNIEAILVTLGVIAIAAWLIKRTAIRQFEGITGDVLGAAQQLTEVAILMALLLLMVGS